MSTSKCNGRTSHETTGPAISLLKVELKTRGQYEDNQALRGLSEIPPVKLSHRPLMILGREKRTSEVPKRLAAKNQALSCPLLKLSHRPYREKRTSEKTGSEEPSLILSTAETVAQAIRSPETVRPLSGCPALAYREN